MTARALIAGHLVGFVLEPEKVPTASNQILERWRQLRSLEAEPETAKGRGSEGEGTRSLILRGLRDRINTVGSKVLE